jgi:hypothetical protein
MKSLLLTILLGVALANSYLHPFVGDQGRNMLESFSVDDACTIDGIEAFFTTSGDLCSVKMVFTSCENNILEETEKARTCSASSGLITIEN